MKALLQRVKEATVAIEAGQIGSINQGLLVLIGLEKADDIGIGSRIIEKILSYRVFNDADRRMNLSVKDIAGGVLLVPQFTLAASTDRGLRPSFSDAMPPADARDLFQEMCQKLKERHEPTSSGRFGVDMQVALVNDGPVTFLLELH